MRTRITRSDDHPGEAPKPSLGPGLTGTDLDLERSEPIEWAARPGRRTTRERCQAGLRGLKHAMRGDSSFFAHAYRGLLIAFTAALLGIDPVSWCLLMISAAMVLIAELAHSAIEVLAGAHESGRDDPTLDVARDIATAGVLVAVVVTVSIAAFVITLRLGDLLAWW